MDVKYVFLNDILEEEVYIEQPDGFSLTKNKDIVCKLHKALCGLKQTPRAWFERLHAHLIKIGFQCTSEDSNIYLKNDTDKVLIDEVFVDDIIFGGDDDLCMVFTEDMKKEFKMSLIGEIKFFIGLQVQQLDGRIFIY
ncbi:hypothetical protein SUGI_0681470 [Cryptomeria japonica]|nr:hypothetical protein SUGI_0681470 [Cryptomeria japonica]